MYSTPSNRAIAGIDLGRRPFSESQGRLSSVVAIALFSCLAGWRVRSSAWADKVTARANATRVVKPRVLISSSLEAYWSLSSNQWSPVLRCTYRSTHLERVVGNRRHQRQWRNLFKARPDPSLLRRRRNRHGLLETSEREDRWAEQETNHRSERHCDP